MAKKLIQSYSRAVRSDILQILEAETLRRVYPDDVDYIERVVAKTKGTIAQRIAKLKAIGSDYEEHSTAYFSKREELTGKISSIPDDVRDSMLKQSDQCEGLDEKELQLWNPNKLLKLVKILLPDEYEDYKKLEVKNNVSFCALAIANDFENAINSVMLSRQIQRATLGLK